MNNPFEVLGILPSATEQEVRLAYHQMAKRFHPDHFRDPIQQEDAARRLTAINIAYEEAIKLAVSRNNIVYRQALPMADSMHLARKMLVQGNAANALRQLLRASSRDASWYHLQGEVLTALDQLESAMQAHREAVHRDPENLAYRRAAFDAEQAFKQSKTVKARIKKWITRK